MRPILLINILNMQVEPMLNYLKQETQLNEANGNRQFAFEDGNQP